MNRSFLSGSESFSVCSVLFALFLSSITAQANVLPVKPNESIQTAIAAAKPGDTIRIESGIYVGQVILDKALTLEGIGKPVLRGTGKGSVVVVAADRCTIRGFVIEHSGGDLQAEDSGLLLKSNDNWIEANELRDVLYGIYLYHAARNTIRGNAVRGRPELETGERGAGLHIWNSPDNLIEDNSITEARDGLYIQSSHRNTVRRNRVSRLRYGLHYMSSDDNKFDDNLFEYNIAGAAIMYSKRIEFRRNAFIHNRGFSSFGILFQDCEDNLAEDNFIIDNATGIFMEALRRSTFRRNVIAENDLGLMVYSNSADNLFAGNNFVENLSPLQLVGRRAGMRWSEMKRGNYWSDYGGYDLDGDGVGDVRHKVQNVFEYLEGNYPRLRLYLSSPAAQALAAAEKTFPIVKGSSEADAAPLMQAVKLSFPFEQEKPVVGGWWLVAGSLAMFSCSAATLVWGQRRQRR
ncbi:MAG: nitrous oxide reductase family maturation protein NosD [Acidobacteria bacterium]|nr:nitrous oxide reductase family maturation protein NosD [Acidobacteriota bacterium]